MTRRQRILAVFIHQRDNDNSLLSQCCKAAGIAFLLAGPVMTVAQNAAALGPLIAGWAVAVAGVPIAIELANAVRP